MSRLGSLAVVYLANNLSNFKMMNEIMTRLLFCLSKSRTHKMATPEANPKAIPKAIFTATPNTTPQATAAEKTTKACANSTERDLRENEDTNTSEEKTQDEASQVFKEDNTEKNKSDETDLILIGDTPILCILPKEINGTIGVTAHLSLQCNVSSGEQDGCTSQPKAIQIDPVQDQDSHIEKTNNDDNSLGWTLVTRKKRKINPPIKGRGNNQESPLSLHARKLRQQRKCFKCLLKGHIQAVCANQRRCLYCNMPGHIIKNCPEASKRRSIDARHPNSYYKFNPKPKEKAHTVPTNLHPKPPVTQPTESNETSTNNPMDPFDPYAAPRDWQTMPMNCPAPLWQRRPQSLTVYLAPRAGLAPSNRFLECSAFIFVGHGGADPYLKRRISSCMARHFHRDPREFPVFTIHEDFGDFLLLFPDADMAEAAIHQANFNIGNNTNIDLHPYSPDLQLAFNPLGSRARIRVYGLPLQHWNRAELIQLVFGFGYPLRFAPYFTNGNYEYLTILVATRDAAEVPFNLDLAVNPHQKDVRVELDGWLRHDFPPPPNQGGGGQARDTNRDQRRGNNGAGPSNHARRSPVGGRNRGNADNRMQRDGRDNSSAGSNWTRPVYNWVDELRKNLIAAGIINEQTFGVQRITEAEALQINATNSNPEENPKKIVMSLSNATVKDNVGNKIFNVLTSGLETNSSLQIGLNVSQTPLVLINEGPPVIHSEGRLFEIIEEGNTNVLETGKGLGHDEFGPEKEVDVVHDNTETQNDKGLNSEDNEFGPEPTVILEPISGENQEVTVEEEQGPPPGYPLPIYQQLDMLQIETTEQETTIEASVQNKGRNTKATPPCLAVRRSSRLQKKYSAGRIRYGVSNKKTGKKAVRATQIKGDYQQSLDPLNIEQAEMVVRMAGIKFDGKIEEEVAKVVMG